jgi:polyphosphate glucokinase
MKTTPSKLKILSIDIGGSSIKATILDSKGDLTMDYKKIATPKPANPENVIKAINTLVKGFPAYDKISVGFPGLCTQQHCKNSAKPGQRFWKDVDFRKLLQADLGKDAQVVNDADMQGLGVVSGKGPRNGNYPGYRFWHRFVNGRALVAAPGGIASPGIKGPRL